MGDSLSRIEVSYNLASFGYKLRPAVLQFKNHRLGLAYYDTDGSGNPTEVFDVDALDIKEFILMNGGRYKGVFFRIKLVNGSHYDFYPHNYFHPDVDNIKKWLVDTVGLSDAPSKRYAKQQAASLVIAAIIVVAALIFLN